VGLRREYFDYIETCVSDVLGDMQGKSMLELGDQLVRGDRSVPEKTGKEYFRNRGVQHVSLDLNGRHGAVKCDLSRPIRHQEWIGQFDVVTNSGTTEHVEPYSAQYVCFRNIHDLLSLGGIAVHLVPDVEELELRGHWKNHCRNYYSREFFQMLADQNAYRLVSSQTISGLRCACIEKTADRPFMQNRFLFLSKIARKPGGITYPGINDSLVASPFYRAYRTMLDVSRPLRHRLGIKKRTRSSS